MMDYFKQIKTNLVKKGLHMKTMFYTIYLNIL